MSALACTRARSPEHSVPMKSIAFVGFGKMGRAIFTRLNACFGDELSFQAIVNTRETCAAIEAEGLLPSTVRDYATLADVDVVFLAFPPDVFAGISDELARYVAGKVIVSLCAGVDLQALRVRLSGTCQVARLMPNTPCATGHGIGLICGQVDPALARILGALGHIEVVDEARYDAAMAIAACGPALVYQVIDALCDGGVRLGLDRETSKRLAGKMMAGSANSLLERGEHPGVLRDEVTTPGGLTIEAVATLEKHGVRYAFIDALSAVIRKLEGE